MLKLGYVDRGLTGPALEAELARAWRRHQGEAKALAEAALKAEQHRLETDPRCAALYIALGTSCGELVTEEGWVGLHEQVTGLAEAKQLSVRHALELEARLIRVAKARGWLHD